MWTPPAQSEIIDLLAKERSLLTLELEAKFDRFAVTPQPAACIRLSQVETASLWIVARSDAEVLVWDDVEEEFGVARLTDDDLIRQWDIRGERLAWSLREFPSLDPNRSSD